MHQPGGSLDSGSGSGASTSAFFNNKGAVAGVFVVVGLVIVGMIAALGLLCFRRRRRQRLDREVTAAAIASSAGAGQHGRSPLDDEADGDPTSSSAHHTAGSYPSTVNGPMAQYGNYGASYGQAGGYDPYAAQQPLAGAGGAGAGGGGGGGGGGGYGGAYAAAAGAAAGGAAGAGGYHAVTSGGGDPYYFDPTEAGRYDDSPIGSTPGGPDGGYGGYAGYGGQGHEGYQGGYSDDPYGGYSDHAGQQYGYDHEGQGYEGQGQGQGYGEHELEGSNGTPGSERGNPLHVSFGFIWGFWVSGLGSGLGWGDVRDDGEGRREGGETRREEKRAGDGTERNGRKS